jgi:hypothetical protein
MSSISIPTDARARTRIELGDRPGNLMSEPRAPSEHPRPASTTRRMRTSLDGAGTSPYWHHSAKGSDSIHATSAGQDYTGACETVCGTVSEAILAAHAA